MKTDVSTAGIGTAIQVAFDAFKSQTDQIASFVESDQKEYERHDLDHLPALLTVIHDGTNRALPASTELLVNMGDPNLMQKATSPNGGN